MMTSTPLWAQIGSELQAVSLVQTSGVRLMSMGGVGVSIADPTNVRNLAVLPRAVSPWGKGRGELLVGTGGVVARAGGVDFTVKALSFKAWSPQQQVFVLRFERLHTGPFDFTPPDDPSTHFRRRDRLNTFLLGYARPVGPATAIGVGLVAPVSKTELLLPSGTLAGIIQSSAKPGWELGAFHQFSPAWQVGAAFSWRTLEERISVGGAEPTTNRYRGFLFRIGASCQVSKRWLVALEWGGLTLKDRQTGETKRDDRFYYGLEYAVRPDLRLRAGSFGGSLALGWGYEWGTWRLDYGYVKDVNKEARARLTGEPEEGSQTHFLSLSHRL
ncbi:MAG TPA: hypothetical protein EYP85_07780 [Armatimonadetes bacterium]|nr:hypothetical protein [Armatimonadota bacterium]